MQLPDEAVEATAEALAVAHYEDDDVWQLGGRLSDVGRKRWRAEAIGVLMPAVPFLMAQAWDEGAAAAVLDINGFIDHPPNPYKEAPNV